MDHDPQRAPSSVDVREAASPRDRRRFIDLPWRLYAGDPNWVPPLRSTVARTLDPARNPFFDHAEARLYLAWRGGRPVGRIAAIANYLHNNYHGDTVGFWGFFETENDPAVAQALLDRAADDLRQRGLSEMRGPVSPSINAEAGLLIDGFDRPPVFLMPYNPPHYPQLVEAAGHRHLQDLYAYSLVPEQVAPDLDTVQRLDRLSEAIRRRHPDLVVRTLDMTRYEEEVLTLGKFFNQARSYNWGFVPITDAEVRLLVRDLKPIVDPDMVLLAEQNGKLVGCLLSVPDINPLLQKVRGRLFPFGWAHLLLGRRRLKGLRIFGAAVLPNVSHLGVIPLLYFQFMTNGLRRGYTFGELSWVSESNLQSLRTLERALKPRLYKTYRVYTREL